MGVAATLPELSEWTLTAIRELKQTDAAASKLQIPFRRTQGQVNSVGP